MAGRRISDVARSRGQMPIELFFEIIIKDRLATSCLMHIGNEENVQTIMRHETHMGGSDAILHGASTHPRVCHIVEPPSHPTHNLGLRNIPPVLGALRQRYEPGTARGDGFPPDVETRQAIRCIPPPRSGCRGISGRSGPFRSNEIQRTQTPSRRDQIRSGEWTSGIGRGRNDWR
jgi:hypothetical protein